jgi:hypothetical protein
MPIIIENRFKEKYFIRRLIVFEESFILKVNLLLKKKARKILKINPVAEEII